MSAGIGSRFPEQYRKDFCNRHLAPGAVFRLLAPEIDPPKIKRFIMLGMNMEQGEAAILFINTRPPKRPDLKALQYPLPAKGKTYIDHDSFADCGHIYERELKKLRDGFTKDPAIFLGALSALDMSSITSLVRSAKTVSRYLKTKYGIL